MEFSEVHSSVSIFRSCFGSEHGDSSFGRIDQEDSDSIPLCTLYQSTHHISYSFLFETSSCIKTKGRSKNISGSASSARWVVFSLSLLIWMETPFGSFIFWSLSKKDIKSTGHQFSLASPFWSCYFSSFASAGWSNCILKHPCSRRSLSSLCSLLWSSQSSKAPLSVSWCSPSLISTLGCSTSSSSAFSISTSEQKYKGIQTPKKSKTENKRNNCKKKRESFIKGVFF